VVSTSEAVRNGGGESDGDEGEVVLCAEDDYG
jgi:hypothetical protein